MAPATAVRHAALLLLAALACAQCALSCQDMQVFCYDGNGALQGQLSAGMCYTFPSCQYCDANFSPMAACKAEWPSTTDAFTCNYQGVGYCMSPNGRTGHWPC